MKVKLTFTEPLLGTLAGSKELAEDFIASKNPDGIAEDEAAAIEALPEQIEKASTLFARNDEGVPILWDYQIKGFFKDACSMMLRIAKVPELRAHKKIIDGLIFVTPRKIPINLSGDLEWIERPLRASTAQGERICLARSETAPAGSYIEIEILCLKPNIEKYIEKWLDYGALRGLGQWRNASYGRFEWEKQ